MNGLIKTLKGNMLEQSMNIADNSIDLLLTDPPYNISENGAQPVWIDKETGKNKTTSIIKNLAKVLNTTGTK